MKKYLKLLWGSKLYGLTNKQSDEDYAIICVDKNDPELEKYKNDPNIEIFTTSEFQEKLNDHDLKAIEILFALWCRQENFMQVKDEMHELIRNAFVENNIEIPVPKIGFVDRRLTPHSALEPDDIDQYANRETIKKEHKQ